MRYFMLLPLLMLMSCSIFRPQAKNNEMVSTDKISLNGTSWALDSLINFTPEKLEQPVTMTFGRDSTNSVYGNGGCNYYNGRFTKNGSKISFSHLLSTKKYCFDGSKTETKLTSVLLSANRVAMDKEGHLLLMKGGDLMAIFHKTAYIGE